MVLQAGGWTNAAPQPVSSSTSQSAPEQEQQPLERRWDEVKHLLARGAYREAAQALDQILEVAPHDPRAIAYRQLCEKRLRDSSGFRVLSARELTELHERLQREQAAQAKAVAHAKTLERQVKREQAAWDAALKRLERETAKQHQAAQRHAKRQAAARPPTAAPRRPPQPATSPSVSTAPTATSSTAPGTPSTPASGTPRVPMTMMTDRTPPSRIVPRTKRPPGAVQVFADHMEASPDRRLATAEGHVRVVFDGGTMSCEKLTLFTDTKDLYAQGRVRLRRRQEGFRGEMLHYNPNTKKGRVLEGTAFRAPWYEHGQVLEHIAEGVVHVKPGYLTSCDFEPPHFRLQSRESTVFTIDKIVRGQHVTLTVEELPLIYLPWLSVADRQTPFFLIPGKNKIWRQFVLGGYRYEWPEGQRGTIHLDWRRNMIWGMGLDHRFETDRYGKGLIKLYYNDEHNISRKEDELPKGAGDRRYRALWRYKWQPVPDTTVTADVQKLSDADFRKEFLFREEVVHEDAPDTFVSLVTGDPNFSLNVLARRRMNRFETVTEAFPDASITLRPAPIGNSPLFSETKVSVANLQTKRAHSENDTDVVRVDWFQQLSYAMGLFRPVLVTPKAGVRQTFYTKDIQGGAERPQGKRDLISGQASLGADASLKLFRVFPVATNWLKLNINGLRHVLTPTLSHTYVHPPTVPNDILNFSAAQGPTNQLTFGIENKLQTRRDRGKGKLPSVDIARFTISSPYTFRGQGNKQGGRIGDWSFDLETFPWPWLRLESDLVYPSHFLRGSRDQRIKSWNLDLGVVGGRKGFGWQEVQKVQTPTFQGILTGDRSQIPLLPTGLWSFGLGHRYSPNDKTESIAQLDWRLSEKWQLSAFHRFTWKEVAGSSKRFNNLREYQYVFFRDLHDWLAEFIYRVDREFGEEVFVMLTLKAYPEMPIDFETSYHQPKFGSQYQSPFSPLRGQSPQ